MSIEKARKHLEKYGMDKDILEFPVSSATVELAAAALGCEPGRIAKTLSFSIGERTLLIVAAGDVKVDNRKYKDCFSSKAKMLSHEEAAQRVGHAVGGVCPFGVNPGVEVYLDESLKAYEYVYPACGSGNSAIKLTIPLLEKTSEALKWIDVCKAMNA